MPVTTLFVGSSSGAKSQAKELISKLSSPTLQFLPWWDAFTPGQTLMEDLDAIKNKVDGALFIFSPEGEATIRGELKQIPNLNVLFEFGYFYGHMGKTKVAMIKYGDFYLPSDFGGYIYITGSKFFRRSAVVAMGSRTKRDFMKWIQAL
ncbi:MAG: nucleotide-binding protein [Armatimonadetes bacterium]|nr:nucleotide-binding protein [Armatimonadota bacterium]